MDCKDDAMKAVASKAVSRAVLWIYKARGAFMISNDCVPKHSVLVLSPPKFLCSSSVVCQRRTGCKDILCCCVCHAMMAGQKPVSSVSNQDYRTSLWPFGTACLRAWILRYCSFVCVLGALRVAVLVICLLVERFSDVLTWQDLGI